MALLSIDFRSEILAFNTCAQVIMPEKPCPLPEGKWPTLYLLHGFGGDHTAWQRFSSIERYVRDMNLAVIMPSVHNGFYTDMKHGERYWTFISEELPAVCERMLPLSDRRENRFAAGLSMGGYGALKLGLLRPERYAAIASLSGAVDMGAYAEGKDTGLDAQYTIFGTIQEFLGSDNDLPAVARRQIAAGATLPAVYMAIGTEDFLYQINQGFLAEFQDALHIHYEEGPGGHDWLFWDTYIARVLQWLPLAERA